MTLPAASVRSIAWLSWHADAFARARTESRPILLSIAASWSHSCREMDRTSYADPAVQRLIQDCFVPIRVDADRRPDIADRYEWLLTIYRIYLTEFKRRDFDAEFFAAKTRKLIRESARLQHFAGHLPEIAIDARYLENLRFSRLSDADKLEKILRDIETVIADGNVFDPQELLAGLASKPSD